VPLAVTAWGRTRLRSSFGSCGSLAGGFLTSAPGIERIPKPVSASQPGVPTSRAELRKTSCSCVGSSCGRTVQTQAAAPATSGAEKLVPSKFVYPLGSEKVGTATGVLVPGATRSSALERLEKKATWSF
jgi:hypothetical protein